ncbi:MAG: hypothetical protein ACI815_000274 [Psychroserpens sp.]
MSCSKVWGLDAYVYDLTSRDGFHKSGERPKKKKGLGKLSLPRPLKIKV